MDIGGTAAGFASQGWNMKFAEEMASSQYQRAVADMKAAGLNPNAVFGSGGGSPSAAPGGQGGTAMGGEGLMSLVSAAKDLAQTDVMKAEAKNREEQNKLIQAQTSSAQSKARADSAAADVSERSDKNYAKTIGDDSPWLKTLDTFKRHVPIDKLISGIGSFFGGRASAKQSTVKAAATMAPQSGGSAKTAAPAAEEWRKYMTPYAKAQMEGKQESGWDWYKRGQADADYVDRVKRGLY